MGADAARHRRALRSGAAPRRRDVVLAEGEVRRIPESAMRDRPRLRAPSLNRIRSRPSTAPFRRLSASAFEGPKTLERRALPGLFLLAFVTLVVIQVVLAL